MPSFSAGLARSLSKAGVCSRAQAVDLIRAGRVRLNGKVIRDPAHPVTVSNAVIEVDGKRIGRQERVYVMLNKPRGLITTTSDDQGRDTVYACFESAEMPRLVPVGRLDKASEGLLLFTNDNDWAARITDPKSGCLKAYHVQVDRVVDVALMAALRGHSELPVVEARLLRKGERNSWIEIVLDEGKNRHIRRLLACFDIDVLRLVRIRIGALELGDLPKGGWRYLTPSEQAALARL